MRRRFVNDGKPREHGRWIYRCVINHATPPEVAERDLMMGKINNDPTKLIHWQPCGEDNTYWAVIKRDTVSRRDQLVPSLVKIPVACTFIHL